MAKQYWLWMDGIFWHGQEKRIKCSRRDGVANGNDHDERFLSINLCCSWLDMEKVVQVSGIHMIVNKYDTSWFVILLVCHVSLCRALVWMILWRHLCVWIYVALACEARLL